MSVRNTRCEAPRDPSRFGERLVLGRVQTGDASASARGAEHASHPGLAPANATRRTPHRRPRCRSALTALAAAIALASPACRCNRLTSRSANVTAVSNAAGIEQIARARCDRANACGVVGGGGRFSTRAACIADVRTNLETDLSPQRCPLGVGPTELRECIAVVERGDCTSVLSDLEQRIACRTSDLCLRDSTSNF